MPITEDKYIPVTESGCWIWLAATNKHGYGMVRHNGILTNAHRASYENEYGKIPKGAHILHSCDCRLCINPTHLRTGTHQDNMTDVRIRERAGNLRFTQEVKQKIAERYQNGETQAALAKEYGTDNSYIGVLIKAYINSLPVRKARLKLTNVSNI